MLGHIAIAAMGGCFSQNPDTGAAEATYFPAEYVEFSGANIRMLVQRSANTTDFALGFTATRFWVRGQTLAKAASGYPSLGILGTNIFSASYERCWATLMFDFRGYATHASGEGGTVLDTSQTPSQIWTFQKAAGTNASEANSSSKNSILETVYTAALRSSPFVFSLGFDTKMPAFRYWGDFIRNEFYGVHWRRLPMRGVENGGVALYEADSKQFIEY